MNFKQFPLIHEVLNEEKLKPESVLDEDKLICVDDKGEKYVFKECRGEEEKVFAKVFPKIRSLNLKFEVLKLPQHKTVVKKVVGDKENQKEFKFILIKYYEGTYYNKSWNEYYPESLGGRGVDIEIVDKSVRLLKDFSLINTEKLSEFNLLEFDFDRWKAKNLPLMKQHLLQKKVISEDQISKTEEILNKEGLFSGSKRVLTNGDFYPRNFIQPPSGKVVVIDWEGRIDYELDIPIKEGSEKLRGQRNAFINYIENHAAFLFVHMWGNYEFRREFIKKVSKEFELSVENLQAALIIKALEQSFLWKDIPHTHLAVDQIQILIDALNKRYVEDMLR
jgi:hypothetical protein